jgi:MFS family permease
MFDIPSSQIGRVSNNLIAAALPFQLVFSLIAGYMFDVVGRIPMLYYSGIAISLCIMIVPWTAPSIFMLGFVRILLGISS